MTNRRTFLKALAAGTVVGAVPTARRLWAQDGDDPWRQVPAILARIRPPRFPSRDFDVTAFGAVGNNTADNTEAFRNAIAACARSGGGRVVVPRGEFLTGAIELKSNVNLYLSSDATIRFTRDINRYPLVFTRWEGVELMNFSPFLDAFEQTKLP